MPVPLNAIRFQDDIVVADLGLGGVVWASDHAMILPMDGASVSCRRAWPPMGRCSGWPIGPRG
jgi:hypothetical protein